jgi:hypothetical protein
MVMKMIDELRAAVRDYGRAAAETDALLRRFGTDIRNALATYLNPEENLVFGVPPHGDWEEDQDYRDAAFSTYYRSFVTLDPVELGLAIRIDNLDDDGAGWVRVVLTLWKAGDKIHVRIGDHAAVAVPLAYQGELTAVCEMIFRAVLRHYKEAIAHDRAGIYGANTPIGFRLHRAT